MNIGSGRRLTINQLADAVLKAFGQDRLSWEVRYQPGRPGEQRHVEADVTRAAAELGWEPQVTFEEGLVETLLWARKSAASPAAIVR